MTLTSPHFLQKDLHNQKLANDLARFWISKLPAGLSLLHITIILYPIQRDVMIPLLADCQRKSPAVFVRWTPGQLSEPQSWDLSTMQHPRWALKWMFGRLTEEIVG